MGDSFTFATLTPADASTTLRRGDNWINDQLLDGKTVNLTGDMKKSPQGDPAGQAPAPQTPQGSGTLATAFNAVGAVANGVGKVAGQAAAAKPQPAAQQPQPNQPRPDPMSAVLLAALVNGNKI